MKRKDAHQKQRFLGMTKHQVMDACCRRLRINSIGTTKRLLTYGWRALRMVVLKERGARCECCGSTPRDGIKVHVDHIKPRKFFPELALDKDNLQILCEVCNHGKGNWDQTDWRRENSQEAYDENKPCFAK